MNQNNNHPNPNVNPSEPPNERGSILKPALVALALLAVSGSLLYAMVVTKPSAPTATQPAKSSPVTAQPKLVSMTLAVSPNPCVVGAPVTCTINLAGTYDTNNNDEEIDVNSSSIGGKVVATPNGNNFVATYPATASGIYPVTAYANGHQVGSTNLEVVAVTDITVNPTPGEVNKFQAVINPNDAWATAFAGVPMIWSGATKHGLTAAPLNQPPGPMTVTATLGTSYVTKTFAVNFGTIPGQLNAACSGPITASSNPSGRTIGWKVVSSDPGVSVSLANSQTADGAANTINVAANTKSGNVVIEAYDAAIGAACGSQTTIQIVGFARGTFSKGTPTDSGGSVFDSGSIQINVYYAGYDCPLTVGPSTQTRTFPIVYTANANGDSANGDITISDTFTASLSTSVDTHRTFLDVLVYDMPSAQVAASISSSDPHINNNFNLVCGSSQGSVPATVTLSASPSITFSFTGNNPACVNSGTSATYTEAVSCNKPGDDLNRSVAVAMGLYYSLNINSKLSQPCGRTDTTGNPAEGTYGKVVWTLTPAQNNPNSTGSPVPKCCP